MPGIRYAAALAAVLLVTAAGPADARQPARPANTAGVASTVNLADGSDYPVAGDTYRVQSPGRTYSCQKVTYDNGVVAYKFELRDGEQWDNDAAHYTDGRQRTQLRDMSYESPSADLWVSFAFLWGNGMPTSYTTIFEAHQDAETGEDGGKPAPVALQFKGGDLHLYTRADADPVTVTPPPQNDRFSTPLWASGTWHNVVLHVRLDPDGSSGVVHLWLDGNSAYSATSTAVGYNDVKGPYFKIGLYRAASTLTTMGRFANYEAGSSSLLDRVANPQPFPA